MEDKVIYSPNNPLITDLKKNWIKVPKSFWASGYDKVGINLLVPDQIKMIQDEQTDRQIIKPFGNVLNNIQYMNCFLESYS